MKKIAFVASACAVALILSVLAPSARAEEENFTLRSGDVLQVTVWKEEGLDRETLVLPDGSLSFPLIGSLKVEGKSIAEAQTLIKEKLHNLIPDASVSITIRAPLGHAASVIGQVVKPGEIVMNHRTTVMQALSQAGGLTPFARPGAIKILRHDAEGKEQAIEFDYRDVAAGDDLEQDIVLNPGDVIIVPTASLL